MTAKPHLTPVFTEAVLQLNSKLFCPGLQWRACKCSAQVHSCGVSCLPDEAIGVIETTPQALLYSSIKEWLVGLSTAPDQTLQCLKAATGVKKSLLTDMRKLAYSNEDITQTLVTACSNPVAGQLHCEVGETSWHQSLLSWTQSRSSMMQDHIRVTHRTLSVL